ncbi:hypothetical protein GCM10009720_16180 [Yaniella flava]|uniref:Uncharacterized protein n=1 Tax=Yaniella flava TaxID=287930 RepID=A0ABP5FY32_9MICC|nr:hypothetical protein [Micrococcaceae bacterium]
MHEIAHHRIDAEGTRIICFSSHDARCRIRPKCHTESFDTLQCHDHDPPHSSCHSQPCWMVEWINAGFLEDSSAHDDPVIENSAVELEFHGNDIGVTWRLAD